MVNLSTIQPPKIQRVGPHFLVYMYFTYSLHTLKDYLYNLHYKKKPCALNNVLNNVKKHDCVFIEKTSGVITIFNMFVLYTAMEKLNCIYLIFLNF